MARFNGKTAIVTGGTTGIGYAAAAAFLAEGAQVVITGQDQARLDAAVASLGAGVIGVRVNVAERADLAALAGRVKDAFGDADIVFANAGVANFASWSDTEPELLDSIFDVNVKGVAFTVQALTPILNDGGAIVVNTSVNNQIGMAGTGAYAASKAAARSMVRTLAGELVGRGIRVNAVSPGPVETPIYGKLGLPQDAVQGIAGQLIEQIPMKRFGKPEEIAKAVLFLASNDASFVTGQELVADGGWTAI